jgi:hypothetical protein
VPLGKKRIDEDNARSAPVVALCQQPAFFHARTQHFQIAGRHLTVERVVKFSRRHGGLAFHGVAFRISIGHERRVGRKARSLHSGKRAHIFHHRAEEAADFFVGVVLLFRQGNSHSQKMVGLKSEFLFAQIPDGLDH